MDNTNNNEMINFKDITNSKSFKTIATYISKIISTSLIVLLVIIGAFLVYYFLSAKKAKVDSSYNPPINLFTILTGSMEPNIRVNDVVVDYRVKDPSDIQVGDVITFISTSFISDGLVVTHRVIDIKVVDGKYLYTTKGDANSVQDSSPAEFSNIVGKVMLRIPQLGRVQEFVSSGIGWLIIVLLPALGVIIYDVIKLIKILGTKTKTDMISNKNDKKNVNISSGNIAVDETLEKIKKNDYINKLNELKNLNQSSLENNDDNKKDLK